MWERRPGGSPTCFCGAALVACTPWTWVTASSLGDCAQNPRVVVMERTNFRTLESLPEAPSLATVDVSFISLRLILPVLDRVMTDDGQAVVLIKPQFEVGRGSVGKGGVVRDASLHQRAIRSVLECGEELGWSVQGLVASPLLGPAGNREFLAHLRRNSTSALDVPAAIESVVSSLPKARSL